ncbi:hypothetical protein C1J01_35405, partial [Nonomuraea aridisoli]
MAAGLPRPAVNAAVAVAVIGVFWLPSIVQAGDGWRAVAGLLLAAVTAAAMMLSGRRSAYAAAAGTAAAATATVAATLLGVCEDPMLAAAWCLYALALTRASRVRGFLLAVTGAVAALAAVTGVPEDGAGGAGQRVVIAVAALSAAWLLGVSTGRQIASAQEAERARSAERAARVQLAVARDVHDVVGHALGVIGAEAGVARSLPDAREPELRDALTDIEHHARSALEEIQALVRSLRRPPNATHAALGRAPDLVCRVGLAPGPEPGRSTGRGPDRDPGRGTGLRPERDLGPEPWSTGSLPRLAELPSLLDTARAAGVRVDARIDVPERLDAAVAAVAYRIVQEAVSNVVRHAPGAGCAVEVRRDGGELVVRVRDDGPGGGGEPGFGLRGMRERAG